MILYYGPADMIFCPFSGSIRSVINAMACSLIP